jgi:hypothetical protein
MFSLHICWKQFVKRSCESTFDFNLKSWYFDAASGFDWNNICWGLSNRSHYNCSVCFTEEFMPPSLFFNFIKTDFWGTPNQIISNAILYSQVLVVWSRIQYYCLKMFRLKLQLVIFNSMYCLIAFSLPCHTRWKKTII